MRPDWRIFSDWPAARAPGRDYDDRRRRCAPSARASPGFPPRRPPSRRMSPRANRRPRGRSRPPAARGAGRPTPRRRPPETGGFTLVARAGGVPAPRHRPRRRRRRTRGAGPGGGLPDEPRPTWRARGSTDGDRSRDPAGRPERWRSCGAARPRMPRGRRATWRGRCLGGRRPRARPRARARHLRRTIAPVPAARRRVAGDGRSRQLEAVSMYSDRRTTDDRPEHARAHASKRPRSPSPSGRATSSSLRPDDARGAHPAAPSPTGTGRRARSRRFSCRSAAPTAKLARLKAGDTIPTFVGPLGRETEIGRSGRSCCVGGCYGIGSHLPDRPGAEGGRQPRLSLSSRRAARTSSTGRTSWPGPPTAAFVITGTARAATRATSTRSPSSWPERESSPTG